MQRRLRSVAVGLLACATLCSCGGETADDSASLGSKADVLREIGQFGRFLDVSAPLYAQAPGQGSPFFMSNPPPIDCEDGTADVTEGSAPTELEYFGARETADYSIYRFDACGSSNRSDASVTYEQDGVAEFGTLRGYDPQDLSDSLYTYVAYGNGTTDYSYVRNVDDGAGNLVEQVVEQVYGRIERASSDTLPDIRGVVSRIITRTVPDGYTLSWQQGTAAEPLSTTAFLDGGRSYAVRGPISYESSQCAGGLRRIAIPNGVTVIDGMPGSGVLSLTLAGSTLTLGFDDEGAVVSFANGSTARLTRAEIEAAMSDPQC